MPSGVYERTPEHNAANSRGHMGVPNTGKAAKGVPKSPEHCAAMSVAHTGVPLPTEHCAAISRGLTGVPKTGKGAKGVPKSPEHIAAALKGREDSGVNDRQRGVPRLPEHIAAIVRGQEEAGVYEAMRGGNDICDHHYIYDHSNLSKYTTKMTRSRHATLHWNMQKSGIIVPHINRGI